MVAPLYLDLLVDQIVIDKQLPGTRQITQGSLRLRGLGSGSALQPNSRPRRATRTGVNGV